MEITPVGFPVDQSEAVDTGELPRELQDMLRRGEHPVLISGGTGKIVRSGFYAVCVEACRLLGCPAVLASQYRELVPDDLPDHVRCFRYLPFAQIMPFMGAIIHHGGIGTIGQAMLAGIPQLVLAHGMDRPDNAFRLKHFGGAEALMFMNWKPDVVAKALQSLMTLEVRERCAILGRRLRDDDALGANTLSEADRVVQAVWVGIWFGIALLVFFYLTHRGAEGAPMRYQRWCASLSERYLTSSAADEEASEDAPEPGENETGTNAGLADTDAVRAGTAERTGTGALRISRHLADVELIALLAVQRTAEGKERFSANAIAALMGGTRGEVLAQVRAIRNVAPPPVFPPLSVEQQTAREQLGLAQQA